MVNAGASADLHLFRHGAYGSGAGDGDAVLDQWTVLLEAWLRDGGWMERSGVPTPAHP